MKHIFEYQGKLLPDDLLYESCMSTKRSQKEIKVRPCKFHQTNKLTELFPDEKLKVEHDDYLKMCENDHYDWHLIVYLQHNQETEIVYCSALPNRQRIKQPFAECLKIIDCRDFNQILMLLTLFPWHTGKRQLKRILASPKEPLTPLDRILADTHGWILYRQQFETIVQLAMGVNAMEAIRIRKDYNAGRLEAYALFEKHELFGEKLSNIIRSRCITRTVQEPVYRIKGAVLLHTYLMGKPEFTG